MSSPEDIGRRYLAACEALGVEPWPPETPCKSGERPTRVWRLMLGADIPPPDFTNPASLGVLMQVVREAWGEPDACASSMQGYDGDFGWRVWAGGSTAGHGGDTEAEAWVAALEARVGEVRDGSHGEAGSPISVACPRCSAAQGEDCDRLTLVGHSYHSARVDAVKGAEGVSDAD